MRPARLTLGRCSSLPALPVMKACARLLLLVAPGLFLAGCLHAQLNGSVAGANITVAELRNPGVVVSSTVSSDEASNIALYGEEAWAGWNAVARHWLLGIFFADATVIDEDALYLVTASGGLETDLDRDLQVDSSPTPVSHDWRAIMSGEQLLAIGSSVSALTEAAFRWIEADIDELSDTALLDRLDAAAVGLVGDTNEDGVIDYGDVVSWTRIFDAQSTFSGDFARLNEFSLALVNGSTESELNELAAAIMAAGDDSDYWRQLASEIDDGNFASADFLYAIAPDPDFCETGELSQAAKDRQLETVNRIRALHGLAAVSYSEAYDEAAQEAALIQHANNYLSHFPAPGDACFTEAGAEASGSGNLTGGQRIIDPAEDMIGHVDDARNLSLVEAAGHRRSTLNPFEAYTAYGQVEGRSTQKVFSFDLEPEVQPLVEVDYVAFPYGDYPFLFLSTDPAFPTPWSFTVIEDKQERWGNRHDYFSGAEIAVTRLSDGAELAITSRYSDTEGFGVPNFLSWQVPDWEYDTRYRVEISDVSMASGAVRDFSYEVFIDYADLVELDEPLESGDRQTGRHLEGSIADPDDEDSYTLQLAGEVTVTASSQYSNQAFYVLLYGPDKQLVRGEDAGFSVTLEPGSYTVVISSCKDLSCYLVNTPTLYQVDFSLN